MYTCGPADQLAPKSISRPKVMLWAVLIFIPLRYYEEISHLGPAFAFTEFLLQLDSESTFCLEQRMAEEGKCYMAHKIWV